METQTQNDIVNHQWAGGKIRILERYDQSSGKTVEIVDVYGVEVPRRNAQESELPGSKFNVEDFKDLTFGEPEIRFLQMILMRQRIGHHMLALGAPGIGKSTMARFVAFLKNIPFVRVQCIQEMNVNKEVLWTFAVDGEGKWEGRMSALPTAMKGGAILLVDELPNLKPAERQSLLQVTERTHNPDISGVRPSITMGDFPGDEVQVEAADDFFILATGNHTEGQGVGAINELEEREWRRIRPAMLDDLPAGTNAARAWGRHFPGKNGTPPMKMARKEYYRKGEAMVLGPDAAAEIIKLIQEFDAIVDSEVLPVVKQSPTVYTTEALDRAFDHFMAFQVKKTGGAATIDVRTSEILESAAFAIEFYYLNSFRRETKMKLPDTLLTAYLHFQNSPDSGVRDKDKINNQAQQGENHRVPVRDYLRFRLRTLMTANPSDVSKSIANKVKASIEGEFALSGLKTEVMNKVEMQYHKAKALAEKLVAGTSNKVPTLDQVKTSFANLSHEELKQYKDMKKPTLLLVPSVPRADYERVFDKEQPGKRVPNEDLNHIWDVQDHLSTQVKFKALLVEGEAEAPQVDALAPSLDDRINAKKGAPMDIRTYYCLTLINRGNGVQMDASTKTIVDGVQSGDSVLLGQWTTGMGTKMKKKSFQDTSAQFRPSIERNL